MSNRTHEMESRKAEMRQQKAYRNYRENGEFDTDRLARELRAQFRGEFKRGER